MYTILALTTHILASVDSMRQQQLPTTTSPSVSQIRMAGDLLIGGVFPVHAKKSSGSEQTACGGEIQETRGVHRVEAMLYALDRINADERILPGIRLGALIVDSCSSPAFALNQSLDFVRHLIGGNNNNVGQCSDGSAPRLATDDQQRSVVAVVGGSYSSVTVQVANLLRLFRIVQVSPASTNADLSDKTRYEYFARTVPSDNFQAKAMVDIAVYFNWTYVSLVYSADEYGEMGADAFKKQARKMNICIAIEERIGKKETLKESVDNLLQKLQTTKHDVGARVCVLFVRNDDVPDLLMETNRQYEQMAMRNDDAPVKQIIWLASEGWDRNNELYTTGGRWQSAQGAIVLMLESKRVPAFDDYFLSLTPGSAQFERDAWLRELWQHRFGCVFDEDADDGADRCDETKRIVRESFSPDDKVQFVIDAVYAIAHALHQLWLDHCETESKKQWIQRTPPPNICPELSRVDGDHFYQTYLLNVSFVDMVGKKFRFDAQGDGPAHYTILNYQPKSRTESNGNRRSDYVEIGRWQDGELVINESLLFWNNINDTGRRRKYDYTVPISVCSQPCPINYRKQLIKDEICCWACAKCEDYEYLVNETSCADCGEGLWPNADRLSCYEIPVETMVWNSWYSILPSVLAAIGIVATIIVIIIYIRFNDTPVVKASGREMSYLVLISLIVCYLQTFVLLAPPTPLLCALKRSVVGFAFATLYSALLVKTNRIHRIFSLAHHSARRPACISPLSQLGITAALAGVQLIASCIWLVISPPGIRHVYPSRAHAVLTCTIADHLFLASLAYDALLITLCTIYAVKTRQVPENFNETKFIGFTMYTTSIIWAAFVPIYFGTGNEFKIQTTTLCISISMSANVALVCIFSPKLYIVLFEKDKNVRKQVGEPMLSTNTKRSTLCTHDEANATQYTALLTDTTNRRRVSTSRPTSSFSSNAAGDTFL